MIMLTKCDNVLALCSSTYVLFELVFSFGFHCFLKTIIYELVSIIININGTNIHHMYCKEKEKVGFMSFNLFMLVRFG